MPEYGNGGALVNTTQNFVNAYTGEDQDFGGGYDLSPTVKQFYQRTLLVNVETKAVFGQHGMPQSIPENAGTSTEWRRPNTFEDVGRLVEGVIPVGKKFGYSAITADIYEYGDYVAISKYLDRHSVDQPTNDAIKGLADAAVRTREKYFRDVLLEGTQVMYAPEADGTEVNSRANLTNECLMTPDLVADVAAEFGVNGVPDTDGAVGVAIVHPYVYSDIRKSEDWVEAHKYASPEEIYNGEIGELHGFRFVRTPLAKVFKDTSDGVGSGQAVYVTEFIGKDAYATVTPEGGNMRLIMKSAKEVGGPLEQFGTAGVWFEVAAAILYNDRLIRVESGSSYGTKAKAN